MFDWLTSFLGAIKKGEAVVLAGASLGGLLVTGKAFGWLRRSNVQWRTSIDRELRLMNHRVTELDGRQLAAEKHVGVLYSQIHDTKVEVTEVMGTLAKHQRERERFVEALQRQAAEIRDLIERLPGSYPEKSANGE